MAFDESLAARIREPWPAEERRGEEDVRLRLLLPQRQRTGRGLEGPAHRPPRPRRGGGGAAGAARPGVRHHRQADAELGGGRAGGRRGRRPVEGVDRAGDEVRADAAEEVSQEI